MEHFTLDELADRFFSDTTAYTKQDVLVDALKLSIIGVSTNRPVTELLLYKLIEAVGDDGDDLSEDNLRAAIATLSVNREATEYLLSRLVESIIAANTYKEE
ncbi:MAG: hypothetical protein IJR52_04405 [Selenomonadaceae bacterium]|nr:hypothetical protein [Selenomonadaceae bacterium]MBR0101949.1 hypothetical protein [Selenomonadaceae bacterium]